MQKAKRVKEEKAERAAHRVKKQEAKKLSEWLKDVEYWCNKAVRLRDRYLPCISCETTKDVQYAAGHYRTVKAASHLRFNLSNIHKQCNSYCNRYLSGNIVNYRPNLIKKIGLAAVEALENDNTPHRYTIEECKELIVGFKALCKQLEKEQS